jgi:hypothetical protein
VVGLEHHRTVQRTLQLGAVGGAEQDAVTVDRVVNGKNLGPAVQHHAKPTYLFGGQQPPALPGANDFCAACFRATSRSGLVLHAASLPEMSFPRHWAFAMG